MLLSIILFVVYFPAAIILLAVLIALFGGKSPIEHKLTDLQNNYYAKKHEKQNN